MTLYITFSSFSQLVLPSSSKRQKRSKAQVSDKSQNGHSVAIDEVHLSTLCDCGNCTVSTFLKKGCPKPSPSLLGALPNLDMDGVSDSNRLIRIGKLCLEHQQISGLFSTLESSVLKSLTNRRVPVDTVSQLLQGIEAFLPPHAHTPLLSHQLSTLKEANTHAQLVQFVSSLTSFFNYSLLDTLINKLGSESDKAKLEQYKTQFNEFSKRNMLECPSYYEPPSQSEFCELVLKVDENFSKLTVGQLAQFMDWFGGFLMISRPSIQLVKVSKKESCHVEMVYPQLSKEVELVCCLATVVREEVLPVSPEQEEMLKAGGILEIHCGELHQVLVSVVAHSALHLCCIVMCIPRLTVLLAYTILHCCVLYTWQWCVCVLCVCVCVCVCVWYCISISLRR